VRRGPLYEHASANTGDRKSAKPCKTANNQRSERFVNDRLSYKLRFGRGLADISQPLGHRKRSCSRLHFPVHAVIVRNDDVSKPIGSDQNFYDPLYKNNKKPKNIRIVFLILPNSNRRFSLIQSSDNNSIHDRFLLHAIRPPARFEPGAAASKLLLRHTTDCIYFLFFQSLHWLNVSSRLSAPQFDQPVLT